ncbi:translin associated factor X [Macroventuria anomochaeta]|uniref:Translin associated factor X n=1 Tax=Macroventuria anomochaeta TaxID=301207 RepID=A0ACB6RY83_9PLEO|nr:translin associated factor X [Macroventuria anomochaeta]KAF2625899.1 translin associated factor X [Macroventuria anomochaeta]
MPDETTECKPEQPTGPFIAMFEGFRKELDEHHDRRERIIKASRDITASSKKIVRNVGQPVPPFVNKSNAQYWETIQKQYSGIASDLQSLNAHRYAHNITGGNQEFIEALSFHHYLETQSLISYDEAKARIAMMSKDEAKDGDLQQEGSVVPLSPEDYILGICDMTGELMRFSVTSMATNGRLPAGRAKATPTSKSPAATEDADRMDIDSQALTSGDSQKPRTVLDDLRSIRLQLEMFEAPYGPKWVSELETKKMPVMRECVDKVEKALYGLTVRGSERPKGWMPDMSSDRRAEVESY